MSTLYILVNIAISIAIIAVSAVFIIDKTRSYLAEKKKKPEWPSELKGCPFCHKCHAKVVFGDEGRQTCSLQCQNCGFVTGFKTFKNAVSEWNNTTFHDNSREVQE